MRLRLGPPGLTAAVAGPGSAWLVDGRPAGPGSAWLVDGWPAGSADRSIRAGPCPCPCPSAPVRSNVVPPLLCFRRFRAQRRPAVVAGAAA